MKWGIRRYQNKDGSLTTEGKKHLEEKAGSYMNSKFSEKKDRKRKNRAEVEKEYLEGEANKNYKDNYFGNYKGSKTSEQLGKDLDDDWDRLMTKYAEATLKDLKMKSSKEAIDYLVEKYKAEDKEIEEAIKELNNPSPRSKMEIAEHDGKFDKEFIDKVKGEDWVSEDKWEAATNQKMLSEYKKYLDNPEKYSKTSKGEKLTMDNADLLKSTSPTGMSGREKDAATLGLKALKKMGFDEGDIDDNNREWFLYEDQTIGLGTVADLVSQGKSKSQIKALAKEASEAPSDKYYDPGYFELADLSGTSTLDKFIDACQEVVKDKNWKN